MQSFEAAPHMKYLLFIALVFFLFSKLVILTGCANIIPPTGGPRDSIPPKVILQTPVNNSTHFTGNKIVLGFNEFIEVKDLRQNVVISPVPKNDPFFDTKLKTITIKWKDTLQPNTTYSVAFGKAIRDINEGNILKDFTYTFSTGAYLDSLHFFGKIVLAATGKTDSTMIAMLYTNMDDSAVIKDKPRYITHCDSGGNFMFNHLPAGTYALYGLKDESGTKKYLSKSQLFAFASGPVTVSLQSKPALLYAYADTSAAANGNRAPVKKTVPKPAATQPKAGEKVVKRLQFSLNLSGSGLDLKTNLILQFTNPLKNFDSTKIRLTDDKFTDIKGVSFMEDSSRKKITVLTAWSIDKHYNLIATKDFAEDTLGNKLLKIDTLSFKTKSESDYGSLRIRFTNLDLSRHPVIQFMQGDAIIFSHALNNKLFSEKLFLPGEYDLRILYDDNQNGVWDPGQFFKIHQQPEKVQLLTNKKKITVKANWDNEQDFIL